MMKYLFIIPALLAAIIGFSQLPAVLNRLDGRWISGNTISEWTFISDSILNNRTYQVIQGDTLDVSHSYIHSGNNGITTMTIVSADGQNLRFILEPSTNYELIWRNMQTDQLPTCIKIGMSGFTKYTWSGLGEPLVFKHEKEGHFNFNPGVSIGMNLSLFDRIPRSVQIDHHNMTSMESALSLNISHTNSIFAMRLEAGFMQIKNTTERYVTGNTGNVYFKGDERLRTPFIAVIPECHFGKTRQLILSVGLIKAINPQKKLTGTFQTLGHPTTEVRDALYNITGLKRQPGVVAGLSYQPKFKIGHTQPNFYCRLVTRSAISAGIVFIYD